MFVIYRNSKVRNADDWWGEERTIRGYTSSRAAGHLHRHVAVNRFVYKGFGPTKHWKELSQEWPEISEDCAKAITRLALRGRVVVADRKMADFIVEWVNALCIGSEKFPEGGAICGSYDGLQEDWRHEEILEMSFFEQIGGDPGADLLGTYTLKKGERSRFCMEADRLPLISDQEADDDEGDD